MSSTPPPHLTHASETDRMDGANDVEADGSDATPTDALAADDPIVAEVRATREALFAAAGYDLEEFARHIRASEAIDGVSSVVRPPRPPQVGRLPGETCRT